MARTTLLYLFEARLFQQCPYQARRSRHFNAMPDWKLHKNNNLLGWNKIWLDAVKCLGDHLRGQRLCAFAMKSCQVVFTLTWSSRGSSNTTSASVSLWPVPDCFASCSHRQYMQGCAKKKKRRDRPKNVVLRCKQGANKKMHTQVTLSWVQYSMSIQLAANKAETRKYDKFLDFGLWKPHEGGVGVDFKSTLVTLYHFD